MPAIPRLAAATLLLASLGALLPAGPARSEGDAVGELVGRVYYEGMPADAARSLDDDDGRRLAALLADPARAARHANAVTALGLCGCGPAFEALQRFDAAARPARIDRASYRAWLAVPVAMAHLASRDPRALDWLEAAAAGRHPAIDFSHRHHTAARLARIRRETAIDAIGLVATPAVDAVLVSLQRASRDAATARRLVRARKRCARIAREGQASLRGVHP